MLQAEEMDAMEWKVAVPLRRRRKRVGDVEIIDASRSCIPCRGRGLGAGCQTSEPHVFLLIVSHTIASS